MPRNHKTALIDRFKAEARQYLKEVEEAADLDLWEKMVGKMFDVLLVYRRALESPETFTFSDGVTRNIDQMAFAHAVADQFPDLDADHECAAFLMRGEKGA